MKHLIGCLGFLLVSLGSMIVVPAQEVDKEKLRQLAKLPKINLSFGMLLSNLKGFQTLEESLEKTDAPGAITALQKELKGDVTDAERYFRLGGLHQQQKDKARVKEAFEKAVELYRLQVKASPNDGRLMSALGESLQMAERFEEAETFVRRAVTVAPNDWKCWTTLGRFLLGKSWSALLGIRGIEDEAQYRKLLSEVTQKRPAAERCAEAQKCLDEAAKCFDQAAAIAPRQADPFTERAAASYGRTMLQTFIRAARGEQFQQSELETMFFSPQTLSDLEQAARWSTNDFRTIGMFVWDAGSCHDILKPKRCCLLLGRSDGNDAGQNSTKRERTIAPAGAVDAKPRQAHGGGRIDGAGGVLWRFWARLCSSRTAFATGCRP